MPPDRIRAPRTRVSVNGLDFPIDQTLTMSAVHRINLDATARNRRPRGWRPTGLAHLLRDRTPETGDLCVITK